MMIEVGEVADIIKKKDVPNDCIVATPKDKIKQLYDEIKKLKEDKEKLIVQLVDMEELKVENRRLRENLDKIRSTK